MPNFVKHPAVKIAVMVAANVAVTVVADIIARKAIEKLEK